MLSRTIVAEPIVAESLVAVADPLVTALRPGPIAPGAEVARALAWSLRPDEDAAAPPTWLLPHQVRGFRRALAALRRYGGALLADPVGSGKTYVALAIAAALHRSPATCLVPAPLVGQWRRIATRLGIPAVVGSHQQSSRGHLPPTERGLVIIDESHHFRHPRTKRYRHVAPWLVGRPVLLLTATPIVNRLDDLTAQLALGVRADALAMDGIPSLHTLFTERRAPPALGRLVFETTSAGQRPTRSARVSSATPDERITADTLFGLVDRLELSSQAAIATLVRSVLDHAAASSPAALAAALRRYRSLLLHARDAGSAGRAVDRASIRRFTAEQPEQLLWWQFMADGGADSPAELRLDDLERIDTLLAAADRARLEDDGKTKRLRGIIADERPTLIFATHRATVHYLRERLHPLAIAWCTGERAGVGPLITSREMVWGWFSGAAVPNGTPRILVTTDVAAEGLDLRRFARVVHYDLPFTPMRLEQREGRAIRLASAYETVEVVRLALSSSVERRLGRMAALARKAKLPAAAGLGHEGRGLWRWRAEIAERYEAGPRCAGVACIPASPAGVLAGYTINGVTSSVLWQNNGTRHWTDDPSVVRDRLAQAATHTSTNPIPPHHLHDAIAALAEPIRSRLAIAAGGRWSILAMSPATRQLAHRLQTYVRSAARRRDAATLQRLEQALRFLAGGHTAGEALRIDALATRPDADVTMAIMRLPLRPSGLPDLELRLTGIVIFAP